MAANAHVLLSGFADEAAYSKTAHEQLGVFAALGLEYYSLRFIDVGNGLKNVMQLEPGEIEQLKQLHRQYGIRVSSIGSPIGKVKLRDIDDGTSNRYVPFTEYLNEVRHAVRLAQEFETVLIRGFSFYPPRGQEVTEDIMSEAAQKLREIVELCSEHGVVYGLEVEANLVGCDGPTMAELYRRVNHPNLVLIFDGGNLSTQNRPPEVVFADYQAMKPGLGWLHIKDYKIDPSLQWQGYVDEERLKNFVPVDEGDSGHERILRDLRDSFESVHARMTGLGAPGVFLELEPHLRAGGQFGGFSGPDGMGIALRALLKLLDYVGIGYHLRDFDWLRQSRGY